MTNIQYRIQYGAFGTDLNDVQSVTISGGRQFIVDPFNASVMRIVCRNIAGWTISPQMGSPVLLTVPSVVINKEVWYGTITDVDINYGIIPAMDEAVITCEGALGLMGRRNIRSLVLAEDTTAAQFDEVAVAVGLSTGSTPSYSIASAQTFTGNGLDAANTLVATEVGRITEAPNASAVFFYGRNTFETGSTYATMDFVTSGTSGIIYDGIDFRSTAENYYTRVTVSPLGFAAQTNNTGAAPYYSLSVASWDYNTSQANSLSQYLLNQFSATTSGPTSITAQYVAQPSAGTSQERFIDIFTGTSPVARLATISFRGSTYNAVVEGYEITITPDNTRATLYLSPQDVNNYLVLNNSVYGRLDFNKLGF
jgi:hypothetical protein